MEEQQHDDVLVDGFVFQNAEQPHLQCSICTAIFNNPVTTPCGHTFCKFCLEKSKQQASKCPYCRAALRLGDQPSETVLIKVLVDELDIQCRLCDWQGKNRDRETHSKQCPKTPKPCRNLCGFDVEPIELDSHQETCDMVLRKCPKCQTQIPRRYFFFRFLCFICEKFGFVDSVDTVLTRGAATSDEDTTASMSIFEELRLEIFAGAVKIALRHSPAFVADLVIQTAFSRRGILSLICSVDDILLLLNSNFERAGFEPVAKHELLDRLKQHSSRFNMVELLPERFVSVRGARNVFQKCQMEQNYRIAQLKDCEWYHAFYLVYHRVVPLQWPDKRICNCASPTHQQPYHDAIETSNAFSTFVTTEFARFKRDHPAVDDKTAFSAVAAAWRGLPQNIETVRKRNHGEID